MDFLQKAFTFFNDNVTWNFPNVEFGAACSKLWQAIGDLLFMF